MEERRGDGGRVGNGWETRVLVLKSSET